MSTEVETSLAVPRISGRKRNSKRFLRSGRNHKN
jgi:hypothetical protein